MGGCVAEMTCMCSRKEEFFSLENPGMNLESVTAWLKEQIGINKCSPPNNLLASMLHYQAFNIYISLHSHLESLYMKLNNIFTALSFFRAVDKEHND